MDAILELELKIEIAIDEHRLFDAILLCYRLDRLEKDYVSN